LSQSVFSCPEKPTCNSGKLWLFFCKHCLTFTEDTEETEEIEDIEDINEEIDADIKEVMEAMKEMYPDLSDDEAYQAAIMSQSCDEGTYY